MAIWRTGSGKDRELAQLREASQEDLGRSMAGSVALPDAVCDGDRGREEVVRCVGGSRAAVGPMGCEVGRPFRLAGQFVQESAGHRVAGFAPFAARQGQGEGQPFLCAGHADVAQAAFLIDGRPSSSTLR